MKVEATDTFFKSLKRMIRHESWWYKTYEAVRYGIPNFFRNVWKFRKELYSHHWWDYRFTLEMLYRSLVIMEAGMKDGIEVSETRDKKVAKIRRAIELLKHRLDDDYIDRAELELGPLPDFDFQWEQTEHGYQLLDTKTEEEKRHSHAVYARSTEMENEEWTELWDIFKGQDISTFAKDGNWDELYDGSGMNGWWD